MKIGDFVKVIDNNGVVIEAAGKVLAFPDGPDSVVLMKVAHRDEAYTSWLGSPYHRLYGSKLVHPFRSK